MTIIASVFIPIWEVFFIQRLQLLEFRVVFIGDIKLSLVDLPFEKSWLIVIIISWDVFLSTPLISNSRIYSGCTSVLWFPTSQVKPSRACKIPIQRNRCAHSNSKLKSISLNLSFLKECFLFTSVCFASRQWWSDYSAPGRGQPKKKKKVHTYRHQQGKE
jgi:hypothetical protein